MCMHGMYVSYLYILCIDKIHTYHAHYKAADLDAWSLTITINIYVYMHKLFNISTFLCYIYMHCMFKIRKEMISDKMSSSSLYSIHELMQLRVAQIHTEKSFRNLIKSTPNQIVFTMHRLI